MANRTQGPWKSYECTGYDNVADKFVACTKHEGSYSITSEDCDNLLSLQSAHETLSAENARLREALAKCITDHGATGYTNNVVYGRRRLDAISETARAALAKGGA